MKTILRTITIVLALGAGVQTVVKALANDVQVDSIQSNEAKIVNLMTKQGEARTEGKLGLSSEERAELIQALQMYLLQISNETENLKVLQKFEKSKFAQPQAASEPGI
jgi:hypothetical protein